MAKKSNVPKKVRTSVEASPPAVVDEIRFYRSNEKPYGALSNLYRRPIIFEDFEFPTAEHAYQAGKARKEAVRDWILSAPTRFILGLFMATEGRQMSSAVFFCLPLYFRGPPATFALPGGNEPFLPLALQPREC